MEKDWLDWADFLTHVLKGWVEDPELASVVGQFVSALSQTKLLPADPNQVTGLVRRNPPPAAWAVKDPRQQGVVEQFRAAISRAEAGDAPKVLTKFLGSNLSPSEAIGLWEGRLVVVKFSPASSSITPLEDTGSGEEDKEEDPVEYRDEGAKRVQFRSYAAALRQDAEGMAAIAPASTAGIVAVLKELADKLDALGGQPEDTIVP